MSEWPMRVPWGERIPAECPCRLADVTVVQTMGRYHEYWPIEAMKDCPLHGEARAKLTKEDA